MSHLIALRAQPWRAQRAMAHELLGNLLDERHQALTLLLGQRCEKVQAQYEQEVTERAAGEAIARLSSRRRRDVPRTAN